MNKEEWLREYMMDRGLTSNEADEYLRLNRKCNFEGMIRKWRKEHDQEEKCYEYAEEYRKEYSPNPARQALNIYEMASRQRNRDNPNQSFNF